MNPSEDARERVIARIEHGEPASMIRDAAAHGGFNLVVIGTRGRGRISEFFIGLVAKRILTDLPCDALCLLDGETRRHAGFVALDSLRLDLGDASTDGPSNTSSSAFSIVSFASRDSTS